ncbi:16S rRNA (adenine(1518)-N(6)/adenine(1519)-N(6))-dimethyltransferase RsmA [Thermosulfurimonas marina]|nr:16S rRNA (adenine(1518)-N(6)/adenine(1519)-N(6))-dimethyltransferase RsmA [Thermosulfurimonas marina]
MPEVSFRALSYPSPREILSAFGLSARKSLGQHFLRRPETALRLVEAAGVSGERPVVELGAGLGLLTWALARRFPRVIAYELDERLLALLPRVYPWPEGVEFRKGDILRLDYAALFRELSGPLRLFGNLPYYLSSRLLFRLYQEAPLFEVCVFMFQKEVVDRLLAPPGGRTYGILSVLTALLTRAERLLVLPPAEFYPPPEVSSAVVKLEFLGKEVPSGLFRLLKAAFGRRRKKLLRNLETLYPRERIIRAFEELGLSEKVRAEAVAPEIFLELALRLEAGKTIQ